MFSMRPFLAGLAAATASAAAVLIAFAIYMAIMLGPAAPAAAPAFVLLPILFIPALLHVLALGLPTYAVLPPARRASLGVNLGASFLIGAVPIPLLLLVVSVVSGSASGSNGPGIDGDDPGLGRLAPYFVTAGLFGLFGMAGGLAFWLVMRDRDPDAGGWSDRR